MMNKRSSAKLFIMLFTSAFLLANTLGGKAKAEGETVSVSPINFIIIENDLGKKLPITVTNSGSTDLTYTIEECLAENINGKLQQIEGNITRSSIEIEETEITVKAGGTGTINTRVRISANGGEQIPCVLIKLKTAETTEVSANSSFLIPYVIQNFTGSLNVSINVDVGSSGILTSPDITITGTVQNTGDKFFTPRGTIVITKNGTTLSETEISSQILGLMMPGESKPFEVKWTNTLDTLGSIGDYQVEVRISNDQTSKVSVGQLIFTYISSDLILFVSIVGVAILAIIIGVVILKKRKN